MLEISDLKEFYYDRLLNVRTGRGQRNENQTIHYHEYEPTPYEGLEELFKHVRLEREGRLVDFGCGLGRLSFFADYHFGIPAAGIEMNEGFYQEAVANKQSYEKKLNRISRIEFYRELAEEYVVKEEDRYFYFFNPFSSVIFMKVVRNILTSYEKNPRERKIILYYPSSDYIFYLDERTPFEFETEIVLPWKAEKDVNERFLIYQLKGL